MNRPQPTMPPAPYSANNKWTARKTPVAPQPTGPQRRFEALSLMPDGSLTEIRQRAPSHPVFESAFAALARGTILGTEEGPIAIEDLVPGMKVETRDAGYQPVLWIGQMTLAQQTPLAHMPARLFRVPVDSFGPARPMPDLMLAPHARLLHRSSKLVNLAGSTEALTPITAFEDGMTVIRVAPVSPVTVYHLAFADHHILRANGLEIESFHPGEDLLNRIGTDSAKLFLSFFPHLNVLSDFGRMRAPHLTVQDYQNHIAA